MSLKLTDILNEVRTGEFLYHGTHSGKLGNLNKGSYKLFVTDEVDVATYYAAKGGEDYFLQKELEFERDHDISPYEYYSDEIDKHGEIVLFKLFYPKGEHPIVVKYDNIHNLNGLGYKGKEVTLSMSNIVDVINIEWTDLEY